MRHISGFGFCLFVCSFVPSFLCSFVPSLLFVSLRFSSVLFSSFISFYCILLYSLVFSFLFSSVLCFTLLCLALLFRNISFGPPCDTSFNVFPPFALSSLQVAPPSKIFGVLPPNSSGSSRGISTATTNVPTTPPTFGSRPLILLSRKLEFPVWHCYGIDPPAQFSLIGLNPIEGVAVLCGMSEREMRAANWMEF
jgi:hypothetical protein